jgi:formylglycine-generating enzyme required for sulfatase activity
MVSVGAFCIDSTEVTSAQYTAFLEAGAPPAQLADCASNTDYRPKRGVPYARGRDDDPVTYVSWCDAYAFCKWAGKRLCGKIGGGSLGGMSDSMDASASQWLAACSHGGLHVYPYGDTYDPSACNGPANPDYGGKIAPVGSVTSCVGGYAGLHDMSGNVAEFEDSCRRLDGGGLHCEFRGGSFAEAGASAPTWTSCGTTAGKDGVDDPACCSDLGFRCCSP